ncbi:MAG: FxsA family protein [Planctomycetota bacterium]|jgi:UPF0716 protein FxsA
MFLKLLFLFTVVPLSELAILLQIGRWIGVWPTIGIVVATGFAGALLAKLAGASVVRKIHQQVEKGQIPSDGLIDGALVLVGGAMLLTPGLLTDLAGLSFLFPPTRAFYRERLKEGFRKRFRTFPFNDSSSGSAPNA